MTNIKEPARSGPGSGRDAWVAYATALGVDCPANLSRADIIARVDYARLDEREEPPAAPVATDPGCSHPECTLDHPHAGPAVLSAVPGQALPPADESMYPDDAVPLDPAPTATEMVVIIPSRGRPESVAKVVQAWRDTDAFAAARMLWAVDTNDPKLPEYLAAFAEAAHEGIFHLARADAGDGMVWKSNEAARWLVGVEPDLFAVGWAGDDHLPRTVGWAQRYLAELHDLGTGVVYGNDLHHGPAIPTQWAMTADIIRTINRMMPALTSHLYSDNSVGDLAEAAGCLRYLSDVHIEHMHPFKKKAAWDDQYRRMNTRERYISDKARYRRWKERPAEHPRAGMASQAAKVRALREGR